MFQLIHHLPLIERECQAVFSTGGSSRFFIRVAPDYGRQTNRDAQLSCSKFIIVCGENL